MGKCEVMSDSDQTTEACSKVPFYESQRHEIHVPSVLQGGGQEREREREIERERERDRKRERERKKKSKQEE